jgi:hypothetical protein
MTSFDVRGLETRRSPTSATGLRQCSGFFDVHRQWNVPTSKNDALRDEVLIILGCI